MNFRSAADQTWSSSSASRGDRLLFPWFAHDSEKLAPHKFSPVFSREISTSFASARFCWRKCRSSLKDLTYGATVCFLFVTHLGPVTSEFIRMKH